MLIKKTTQENDMVIKVLKSPTDELTLLFSTVCKTQEEIDLAYKRAGKFIEAKESGKELIDVEIEEYQSKLNSKKVIFSINGKGVYFTPDMENYSDLLKKIEGGEYKDDNTFFGSEKEAEEVGYTRYQ